MENQITTPAFGLAPSQDPEITSGPPDVVPSATPEPLPTGFASGDKGMTLEQAFKMLETSVTNEARPSTRARWRIVVDESQDPNDPSTVEIGINGRAYQVRRGVAADVPPEVIAVLNDAIITKSVPIRDASGNPIGVDFRNSRRFPFTLLGKSVREDGVVLMTEGEGLAQLNRFR